jgi:hypothetical protein
MPAVVDFPVSGKMRDNDPAVQGNGIMRRLRNPKGLAKPFVYRHNAHLNSDGVNVIEALIKVLDSREEKAVAGRIGSRGYIYCLSVAPIKSLTQCTDYELFIAGAYWVLCSH